MNGVHAVGVGQVQVEKYAVRSILGDSAFGIADRLRPVELESGAGIFDQLLDEQRIATVILDQEQGQRRSPYGRGNI